VRLIKCRAVNFMGLADLELDLDHDVVVLLADNGVGKSSVLKAMRIALGSWLLGIQNGDSIPIKGWMMRYQLKRLGYELVKDYIGPASVSATAVLDGIGQVSWMRSRKVGDKTRTDRKDANCIRDAATEFQKLNLPLPLIAYYGARRRVPANIKPKRTGPQARTAAYTGTLDSSIDFSMRFGRWWRLRDQAAQNTDARNVYDALGSTLSRLLPGVESIHFDPDFEEPLIEFQSDAAGGGERAFSSLSDGFQNILSLGLDLALRALQLNPELGASAFSETPGVVLIDEIDQHLHPTWQLTVAKGFYEAFPKMQFIIATHSPLVALGSAQFAQTVHLRADASGARAVELESYVLGATVDETLRSEAFDLGSTWSPRILELLTKRSQLLEDQQKYPESDELSASLRENALELEKYRSSPVLHTEDLIRLIIRDLAGDVAFLTPQDLEALRRKALERIRSQAT
jgi:predicted ATP-binding protein involved in virulence